MSKKRHTLHITGGDLTVSEMSYVLALRSTRVNLMRGCSKEALAQFIIQRECRITDRLTEVEAHLHEIKGACDDLTSTNKSLVENDARLRRDYQFVAAQRDELLGRVGMLKGMVLDIFSRVAKPDAPRTADHVIFDEERLKRRCTSKGLRDHEGC